MTAIPSPPTPASGDVHSADAEQGQRIFRLPLWVAQRAGDVIQLAVAVLLLVIAGIVLYRTCTDLLSSGADFPTRVTDAINGVLFVVIVLELIETVLSHFEGGGFQLQPFLVIGIISAVRHILTVGARLSLSGEGSSIAYSRAQVELGVNAGVVLALALALIMVRRNASPSGD